MGFLANINSLTGGTRALHRLIQGGLTRLGNCTNINFTDEELNNGNPEIQGTYGGIIVENQSVSPNQAYVIWGKNHETVDGVPVRLCQHSI